IQSSEMTDTEDEDSTTRTADIFLTIGLQQPKIRLGQKRKLLDVRHYLPEGTHRLLSVSHSVMRHPRAYLTAGAHLRHLKSSRDFIEGDPDPDKRVGKGPWVVTATSDITSRVRALEQQQLADRTHFEQQLQEANLARETKESALQKQLDSLAVITAVPFINNAAVQALKFATGDQPQHHPPSCAWSSMIRRKDARARAFILGTFGPTSSKKHCAAQLDQLVDRRNGQLHMGDLGELQGLVLRALELADTHQAARQHCVTALYVLEHFDQLKLHFGLKP
ncbi:MAG: hypothetical protein MMC23_010191, partial [Stictis urceolatum]|nr:hypothetical protein [Stictis urceolata]